mgnify:CR=1 FL=1
MDLKTYLAQDGSLSVAQLAAAIGVKQPAQVRQWQHGYADRLPSPLNCTAIEQATDGAVTRRDLRPSDWHLIWPELVDAKHPAPITDQAAA